MRQSQALLDLENISDFVCASYITVEMMISPTSPEGTVYNNPG